ncbi:hypothetical protein BDK51DRAFT_28966 [Blyttiomyces helicus]|uniref:Uncharacterized protein n=1 Tax=Blyttiomyces helicus TaxID=388810 RepID=A0A4P9WBH9_9FUNG|nr:hypothetical protein BDK51DRAFT_28966 [Blyttiomyces helicus]|eukprot:RKO88955.1 hypothetical protein BDK51DRAFT_28966 [Blyttiomyces helicus]
MTAIFAGARIVSVRHRNRRQKKPDCYGEDDQNKRTNEGTRKPRCEARGLVLLDGRGGAGRGCRRDTGKEERGTGGGGQDSSAMMSYPVGGIRHAVKFYSPSEGVIQRLKKGADAGDWGRVAGPGKIGVSVPRGRRPSLGDQYRGGGDPRPRHSRSYYPGCSKLTVEERNRSFGGGMRLASLEKWPERDSLH